MRHFLIFIVLLLPATVYALEDWEGMMGATYPKFPEEVLESILEAPEGQIYKEINQHVTKTCLRYFANKEMRKISLSRQYQFMTSKEKLKYISQTIELLVWKMKQKDFAQAIYGYVKEKPYKTRLLYYGASLDACKESLKDFSTVPG